MMTPETFRTWVEEFAVTHCGEYIRDYKILFEHSAEYVRAVVTFEDFDGGEWRVPMCVDPNDDSKISIDGAEYFDADDAGLYLYLWGIAKVRLAAYE